jgi:glutaredoxin-related protein
MINRFSDNYVEIEYLHKLNEDIGDTLKAGIVLKRTPIREKLTSYSQWNGMEFVKIHPEKVTLYQKTTRVTVEEAK